MYLKQQIQFCIYRSYSFTKRRKWMKIHIGIDPKTQEILLSKLTDNNSDDIDVAIDLFR